MPEQIRTLAAFSWLVRVLFISIGTCALANAAEPIVTIPFQIRGILQFNGESKFSVHQNNGDRQAWIGTDELYHGLTILDFDPSTGAVIVSYGDETVEMYLSGSRQSIVHIEVETGNQPMTAKEIDELVAVFAKKEKQALPNPDSPIYATLEQAMHNRVASFRNELESLSAQSKQSDTTETIEDSDTVHPALRTNQIRPNAINSRIWASDHIKYHGLPDSEDH